MLVVPCVRICAYAISCGLQGSCSDATLAIVFGCLGLASFLSLTSIATAFVFDQDGHQANRFSLARSQSRVEMVALCIVIGLAILFGVEEFQSSKVTVALLFLFGNAAIAALYTWFQPFSHDGVQRTRTAFAWALTWLGICLSVTALLDDSDDRTGVLMLLSSTPLVVILSQVAISRRRTQIMARPLDDFDNAYEVGHRLSSSFVCCRR